MAAGLGFKTFTTGEVLTAGDVNGYLMQGVLVFASAAARNAAITSPQEGQFAFTKDTNGLWYYDGAAWVASGATGDIEGVSVTAPITGGGTSGTVTIGIDSTAVVPSQTGNSGKYLTTNGTASSWGTVAAGSMTLISTTTLTGATVTLSSIPQTYKMLRFIIKGMLHNGGGNNTLEFKVNSTSGIYVTAKSTTNVAANTITTSLAEIVEGFQPAVTGNLSVHDLYEYANTTTYKYLDTKTFNSDGATTWAISNYRTAIRTTSAITSLNFALAASTFNGGTLELYGVN